MSSPLAEPRTSATEAVQARLKAYYTRYYRDALGIPDWQDLVHVRLNDSDYERRRLARLEHALGRSVRGLELLNVGCGPGGFNAVAHAAGARVWGVDTSAEAVLLSDARVPGGRALAAAAEALPFPDRAFDLVYCYSTLEHVEAADRVTAEMVRVLRPGGKLYLHAPNRWSWYEGHYKVPWVPGLPRWAARSYLAARGRPTGFLATLRPVTLARCRTWLLVAGARIERVLDGEADRPVGGRLWPLIRTAHRLFGVRPQIELVAVRSAP